MKEKEKKGGGAETSGLSIQLQRSLVQFLNEKSNVFFKPFGPKFESVGCNDLKGLKCSLMSFNWCP